MCRWVGWAEGAEPRKGFVWCWLVRNTAPAGHDPDNGATVLVHRARAQHDGVGERWSEKVRGAPYRWFQRRITQSFAYLGALPRRRQENADCRCRLSWLVARAVLKSPLTAHLVGLAAGTVALAVTGAPAAICPSSHAVGAPHSSNVD
jgi:hypothetical protein